MQCGDVERLQREHGGSGEVIVELQKELGETVPVLEGLREEVEVLRREQKVGEYYIFDATPQFYSRVCEGSVDQPNTCLLNTNYVPQPQETRDKLSETMTENERLQQSADDWNSSAQDNINMMKQEMEDLMREKQVQELFYLVISPIALNSFPYCGQSIGLTDII